MNQRIPNYALYGDDTAPGWLDMVHHERIPLRSSMYDFDIAPHVHEGLVQVLYITAGGGEVFCDGATWQLRPPALVVVPARHVHGFRFHREIDGHVVTAAQRPLESLAAVGAPDLLAHIRRPQATNVPPGLRHLEALGPLFEAIERETRMHAGSEVAAGTALLMAVFVQIARVTSALRAAEGSAPDGRSRKAEQVDRFRALVEERFKRREPVEAYAAELALSAGQLSRLCREVLGLSSLEVVNERVMHEAERELVYSTLSIKQVAAVLGFEDEAYFGRFFKKHRGQTPTEFRQASRQRLAPAGVAR